MKARAAPFHLEIVVGTVYVDHLVKLVACQSVRQLRVVGTHRRIGIFCIMVPLERLGCSRLLISVFNHPKIAVKSALGA